MPFKKIIPFFVAAFLALSLASCGSIEPLTVSSVDNFKIKSFNKQSATIEITMKVKNPNRYRFKVLDNNLHLTLNNNELGTAKIKDRVVIPKRSENSYTFEIETNYSRMALASIPSLVNIAKTKNVELKLTGDVKVRSMGISKKFPIDIVERIDLSKAVGNK
jgi:LEA14-like dessication related protein